MTLPLCPIVRIRQTAKRTQRATIGGSCELNPAPAWCIMRLRDADAVLPINRVVGATPESCQFRASKYRVALLASIAPSLPTIGSV